LGKSGRDGRSEDRKPAREGSLACACPRAACMSTRLSICRSAARRSEADAQERAFAAAGFHGGQWRLDASLQHYPAARLSGQSGSPLLCGALS